MALRHDDRARSMTRFEALALLKSVPIGRVVFSHQALPAIRPVNHVLVNDVIAVRTHSGAALLGPAQDGAVVAYEADTFDPVGRTGWSVVVTGVAHLVQDAEQRDHLAAQLSPWIGNHLDQLVTISLDIVTGYHIR